jgi:thiol-disulfide isomerase/thioredoxin/uncharacterized membrane protein YphA (DoxX/SURF4 family)
MNPSLVLARIVLVGVFAVAGFAKLQDLVGFRKTAIAFGVPTRISKLVAIAVPLFELAIAVLLLRASTAWGAGLLALALLTVFTAAIVANLARGEKTPCQCFGQLSSKPIGWSTLGRNGLLGICAGSVIVGGHAQPSLMGVWTGSAPSSMAILISVIALAALGGQTWLIFHLFKQHGRLLLRLDEIEKRLGVVPTEQRVAVPAPQGLPVGIAAPSFTLPALDGSIVRLDHLQKDKRTIVLIFSDPECGPCKALVPQIRRWQREHARQIRIAVLSRRSDQAKSERSSRDGPDDILLQSRREVADLYRVAGTPSAVLIRSDGAIGSPLATGADAIAALITTALAISAEPAKSDAQVSSGAHLRKSSLAIGEPAPTLRLRDLEGRPISGVQGRTLLLFWNPNCGFCQRMLPDLKAIESERQADAPTIVIVSAGTVEANRGMGLRSIIALDVEFSVGRQFGANGTPSAVLIDAEGRIGSALAVGAPQVLALAQSRRRTDAVSDPFSESALVQ